MASAILPGVYITVRNEGLISVGGVSTGNIGIVGTALEGPINKVETLTSFADAQAVFGPKRHKDYLDAIPDPASVTLLKALELAFGNGASTVMAVRASDEDGASYEEALMPLANEIVNIVLLAGQDAGNPEMQFRLAAHLAATAVTHHERIAITGSSAETDVEFIADNVPVDIEGRIVYVAPGIVVTRRDPATGTVNREVLSGAYTAAALAGLLSSIPVQISPTNKPLNLEGLAIKFNRGQLEKLVRNNVVALEVRDGFRVVKGVTTSSNVAWQQITTRRIVDYALYGVRAACSPYIGKLNNERVRGAMKATIDGFLTRMVEDEALIDYELSVTATRAQEIAGQAMVAMTIRPTFSIDYVMVVMSLG